MTAKFPAAPLFAAGGYEIDDERLVSCREIVIRAEAGPMPRVGDPFTLQRLGELYDLVVVAVLVRGRGWTARCGVWNIA